jgi:hypothetical protein
LEEETEMIEEEAEINILGHTLLTNENYARLRQ